MTNFCDFKTTLNIVGLVLTMIGVYIIFINSPVNEHTIDGGTTEDNHQDFQRETAQKNKHMKYGVYIVILGTMLQLTSNYV
jgi:uncharacterized membrane protein